eukprot:GHVS01068667.1.p1 GENE.GHVS01068667.1~~GHVS01068667.1.p1  ORF type:complete len:374 (+),score=25.24 GHVS01068667.1:75-1196(+)
MMNLLRLLELLIMASTALFPLVSAQRKSNGNRMDYRQDFPVEQPRMLTTPRILGLLDKQTQTTSENGLTHGEQSGFIANPHSSDTAILDAGFPIQESHGPSDKPDLMVNTQTSSSQDGPVGSSIQEAYRSQEFQTEPTCPDISGQAFQAASIESLAITVMVKHNESQFWKIKAGMLNEGPGNAAFLEEWNDMKTRFENLVPKTITPAHADTFSKEIFEVLRESVRESLTDDVKEKIEETLALRTKARNASIKMYDDLLHPMAIIIKDLHHARGEEQGCKKMTEKYQDKIKELNSKVRASGGESSECPLQTSMTDVVNSLKNLYEEQISKAETDRDEAAALASELQKAIIEQVGAMTKPCLRMCWLACNTEIGM